MTTKTLLFSAILLSGTILSSAAGAEYIPLTPKLGDNSAYTLTKLSEKPADGTENIIIDYEVGQDNQIIEHYYKYEVKPGVVSHAPITSSNNLNGADINGHFVNNNGSQVFIYNKYDIGNITGDAVNNRKNSSNKELYGVVLYNNATIGNITGDLIGNGTRTQSDTGGGAIFNRHGILGDINAAIIANHKVTSYVGSNSNGAYGGFLYSDVQSTVGNIYGDIIGNEAIGKIDADGGAIFNYEESTIGNITATTIAHNKTISSEGMALGGFLYNDIKSTIGNISGNIIGNEAQGKNEATGGAIYNNGTIDDISATTIANNKAISSDGEAQGGFLANYDSIGNISGNIIGNEAQGKSSAHGGAIWGSVAQYDSDGNVIGNVLSGTFANNKAISSDGYAGGGFLYDSSHIIGTIIGDIIGNEAQGKKGAYGGAIYNSGGLIGKIDMDRNFIGISLSGTFANNKAISSDGYAQGGFLYNLVDAETGNISGDIIGNEAQGKTGASGGAIYNDWGTIGDITATTIANNKAISSDGEARGGFLYNYDYSIGNISGDITGNEAQGKIKAAGGAIHNDSGTIKDITATIIANNKAISSDGYAQGGAIYNGGILPALTNIAFSNNYVEGINTDENKTVGGAIYSITDISLAARDGDTVFSGNYVKIGEEITGNDIYMSGKETTPVNLNLSANNGTISFDGGIDGQFYNININGSGVIEAQAGIKNANIVVGSVDTAEPGLGNMAVDTVVTNVAKADYLNGNNSLTLNSGTVNIGELNNNLHFNQLAMNGGQLNIEKVGVDLAAKEMGTVTADEYSKDAGVIEVKDVKVLEDGAEGTTTVQFTESLISDKVVSEVTKTSGKLWNYDVSYDQKTGNFNFYRPEKPTIDDVNPEVITPVVAAAATVAVLNDEIYSRVLNDVDAQFSGSKLVSSSDRGIHNAWVKTFGSKDDVDLKGFEGADTKFYGVIGGLSSDRINEGNGWSAIYSVYGAYASGEQKFASEKVTNNGGYLGLGANFYNGDFFIGTTLNAGVMRNRSEKTGVDGKDKFNSYVGGIAGKMGYDYYIGSFTVEPSVYASYTIIRADDYMTKSGAKVEFGNMGVIEAAPGLKLAKDFGEGYKGYVSGRYVWSFTEGAHVTANQFDLPDVELEDYAEYGLGLEKNWQDSSGFLEVKRRDGGRSGWNFTAGFKTAF